MENTMPTSVSLFDYDLPQELIAQRSVEPRDHSRLMIVDRQTGAWQHKHFYDIVDELRQGDVLVMNNTKVFRARLEARVNGKVIEVFLLRPQEGVWDVLVKPGRRVQVGDVLDFGSIKGTVLSKADVFSVLFSVSNDELVAFANEHGEIPVPPYVHEVPDQLDKYQTVYAKVTGSVAAPTAGFHFTQELLENIRAMGVEIYYVTLHVGLGTFRPMKSETIEEHEMHSEFVMINEDTAQAINKAKKEGRRIVAVGTTTVRTLEGVATLYDGNVVPFSGDVNLFISPGFTFHIVDALITNFHLPKSTLLVLVSAFAGRERILAAYHDAVREKYRFFSFGDSMFIQ